MNATTGLDTFYSLLGDYADTHGGYKLPVVKVPDHVPGNRLWDVETLPDPPPVQKPETMLGQLQMAWEYVTDRFWMLVWPER